jgi:serine protease Do
MDEKDELNIPALSFQEDNKQGQSTEVKQHQNGEHATDGAFLGGAPRRRTTSERGTIPRIISNDDKTDESVDDELEQAVRLARVTASDAKTAASESVSRGSDLPLAAGAHEGASSVEQGMKEATQQIPADASGAPTSEARLSALHMAQTPEAATGRSAENVRTIKLDDGQSEPSQQVAQKSEGVGQAVEAADGNSTKKPTAQTTRRAKDDASTSKKTKTANRTGSGNNGSHNNWYAPFFISLMGALVGCLLFVAVFGLTNAIFNSNHAVDQNTKSTHEYIPPQGNESATSAVVAAVSPGIVTVLTGNRQHYLSGNGSGIVYKEQDGKIYILTNAHVIASAAVIEVYRNDLGAGSVDRAEVLAADDVNDIAVLVIEKPQQSYPVAISFEDSTKLKVGQKVVAIGSPYVATLGTSFSGSVTEGIVSGLNREIEASRDVGMRRGKVVIQKYIQTDAAINGGNSGGALIDMSGNLIGMNSARINSADNIGFAIATNDIIVAMKEMDVPLPTSVS